MLEYYSEGEIEIFRGVEEKQPTHRGLPVGNQVDVILVKPRF